MSESLDELTVEHWEGEEQVVKELKKHILTKGSWATLMFLYQELNRKTKEFQAPKARIVRYRKTKVGYIPQSKFNISSAKQAREIVKILQDWFAQE